MVKSVGLQAGDQVVPLGLQLEGPRQASQSRIYTWERNRQDKEGSTNSHYTTISTTYMPFTISKPFNQSELVACYTHLTPSLTTSLVSSIVV